MAVLQDIRNKGGVIITIVIGIALLSFIIGDFLPGGGVRNLDIAEVGGTTLSLHDYENRITEVENMYKQNTGQSSLDERTMDMIRDQAWQFLINETVMEEQYNRIGLVVSPEELFDIVQGPNPNQRVKQYFTDPQTGEFNRTALINFLKNKGADPNASWEWNMLEKSLLEERYVQKFTSLLSNGMFVPAFMSENENQEVNTKVDIDYVVRQYATVPDSLVKVTTSDLKKYYEANKKQWEQEASRDIEYVLFSVAPSDEDRTAADEWMAKMKPEFEETDNAAQFVNLNSRIPFDSRFLKEEQLPVQAAELFDAPVGTMVGPFQDGESLKMIRSAKRENRPDSVKIQQIVLMPQQQTQQAFQEAVTLADSIKTAIEKGAGFGTLAVKYSADPSAATNAGDIGWVHEVALQDPSMRETLFGLKKGEVTTIENPQGIFVIQVTERGKEEKKIQLATLQYDILPSTRTEQIIYSQASKFAVENRTEAQFNEASTAQSLNKRIASYLGENDRQIPGLSSARQVVRWAYDAKRGDVSDVFALEDAYVIAVLKNIRKKGVAPFEQVASEIDFTVRKEKKAGQIAAEFSEAAKNAASFGDLAANLNLPVESSSGITFSSFSATGVGVEPKLIATATMLDEGTISQPIEGINGVYLITVKQITDPEEDALEQARMRLTTTYSNRSVSESVQALRNAANVKDMRSKFY